MSKHTQTPWKAYRNYVTSDDGDTCIAAVDGETTDHATANRDLIVRAVNSHEAMVEALEEAVSLLDHAYSQHVKPGDKLWFDYPRVQNDARAALKLAKAD